jgi:peptidoglycan biosynthesis protein MviN/MurJ (putative lipid II flippase)
VANTLSSTFNLALLLYALRRKLGRLEFGELRQALITIAGAALLSGLVAWLLAQGWDREFGHGLFWHKLGHVFVPATLTGLLYLAVTNWLKVSYAKDVAHLVLGRLTRD